MSVLNPFVAVILICPNTVGADACNETTAADVLSNGVENELSCVMGCRVSLPARHLRTRSGRLPI
jgi:hypothetical protein